MNIHTTKEGDQMLIASMTDDHLLNMIRLLCGSMANARMVITGTAQEDPILKVLEPGFSHAAIKTKAEETIRRGHSLIQPYVLEAALRRLDIQAHLHQAYGRSAGIPTTTIDLTKAFQLTEATKEEDIDWD